MMATAVRGLDQRSDAEDRVGFHEDLSLTILVADGFQVVRLSPARDEQHGAGDLAVSTLARKK
jgi:hypothetical protein